MACRTHCILNLQQDVIVAVCPSPSLHLSEMSKLHRCHDNDESNYVDEDEHDDDDETMTMKMMMMMTTSRMMS